MWPGTRTNYLEDPNADMSYRGELGPVANLRNSCLYPLERYGHEMNGPSIPANSAISISFHCVVPENMAQKKTRFALWTESSKPTDDAADINNLYTVSAGSVRALPWTKTPRAGS